MSRIQHLQQFLAEDPNDPFNLYALALEYLKHDQKKASELFDQLLIEHPDYVPTYYHAGKLFQELRQTEKALLLYETGISKAKKVNDLKALRELQAAHTELLYD
ncbi:MAG: tetratricopeptide repeat protein [Cyclobacteriaceae bacterium]|nr:tetratricopeptide repeat protein [Cyclobacteriaceae bacterium]